MLSYPSTVLRRHRERPSREKQELHEVTLLKIRNSNQKPTIPSLNMSTEHRKKNQKSVEKVIISDFVVPNKINFIEMIGLVLFRCSMLIFKIGIVDFWLEFRISKRVTS